jgi:hypothetical protein
MKALVNLLCVEAQKSGIKTICCFKPLTEPNFRYLEGLVSSPFSKINQFLSAYDVTAVQPSRPHYRCER